MKLITIKTFDSSIDAHILKSKLRSEGIECFLFDDGIVSMNMLYSIAVGGIKLKIAESNLEKATLLLNQLDKLKHTNEENEIISCSKCDSTDLINGFKSLKSIKGFFSMLLAFFTFTYPIYYNTVYKCKSCDFEFKSN